MLGRPSAVFFDEADQAQCGHDSCGKAPRTGHDSKVNHTETQLAMNVMLPRMVAALNRAGTAMQHKWLRDSFVFSIQLNVYFAPENDDFRLKMPIRLRVKVLCRYFQ